MARKALLLALALAFLIGLAGGASAVDPTGIDTPGVFTEVDPDAAGIPTANSAGVPNQFGASAWFYQDEVDSAGSVWKNEGSYRVFQQQTAEGTNDQGGYGAGYYEFAAGNDAGPHDGYDTGSNKCKTCHAVHRAQGSFRLMRVDSPDDACSYCHIGDHKHSLRGAYYRTDSVYPANGHTMGAGTTIPDSTVKAYLTDKTITYVDSDGNDVDITYSVREYASARNKMFTWTTDRASYHATGLRRLGPTFLSCLSCHQPHNADQLIWKPSSGGNALSDGYKLLRSAPSGSTKSVARMEDYGAQSQTFDVFANVAPGNIVIQLTSARGTAYLYAGDTIRFGNNETTVVQTGFGADYDPTKRMYTIGSSTPVTVAISPVAVQVDAGSVAALDDGNMIEVPIGTVSSGTTGGLAGTADPINDFTTWTEWKGPDFDSLDDSEAGYAVPKLSLWCADCHNLNIGYPETADGVDSTAFRTDETHSDRTHTSSGDIIDCWNCHSSNMPLTDASYNSYTGLSSGVKCNKCHYFDNGASYYYEVRSNPREDYGTAGPRTDFPHSGASTGLKLLTEVTIGGQGNVLSSNGSLDSFCMRCHDLINEKM
ncbi:MAG: hypothetical protein ACYC1U_03925 [Candidatus Aquicultorales bacterium]